MTTAVADIPAAEGPASEGWAAMSNGDRAARVLELVEQYWGFNELRPLQAQAIAAGINQVDSLVVMPTGGGKSLCYQVPPLVMNRMDVVVSPLISLMKDQVDGLVANGYPAAALHSHLSPAERREVMEGIRANRYRLLFTSPERMMTGGFLGLLSQINVRSFAIDEAHCISQWGHDFRPEYRQMSMLKTQFPRASVHAFTATATPRVREDIVQQLGLQNAQVLVGTFDRPNLSYHIVPRMDETQQVMEIVRRHENEAVIVYCISRKDTESLAESLRLNKINAAHYHAGMEAHERRRTQERFASEELDVVVATVAFGMGIDRSNVRCVIHAAMPKTIEAYQQETGRAGRDGLEAECVMLYSGSDVMRWKRLIEFSAERSPDPGAIIEPQMELLNQMQGLCATLECRHRALSRYFGQTYPKDDCGACDVCLGESEGMADSQVIAQKILSCIARVEQRFGLGHVVAVLRGANTEMVRKCRHDQVSTYGILRTIPEKVLKNLVYQLIDQGLIGRATGQFPTLYLNDDSLAVLRGDRVVQLTDPEAGANVKTTAVAEDAWAGVDRGLFDHLRELRRTIAAERSVPAFVVFSDNSLRSMARLRPTTVDRFAQVHGVGKAKLADLGERFVEAIVEYCEPNDVQMNTGHPVVDIARAKPARRANPQRDRAMQMFAEGAGLEVIAAETGRARSTIGRYLADWIEEHQPENVSPWVDDELYARIASALETVGMEGKSFKPLFEHFDGQVAYEYLHITVAHLNMRAVTPE